MTTFRKGDKVRLDVEGVVVTSDKHGTQVRLSGREAVGNGGDNYFFDDSLLTVVKKAVAVGDTISGDAAYTALPIGAVLKPDARWGESALIRVADGFIFANKPGDLHAAAGAFFDPRELAYLPD